MEYNKYKIGLCDVFTLALHNITKLRIGIIRAYYQDDFMEEDDDLAFVNCHAVILPNDDNNKIWFDVDGYHTEINIKNFYNIPENSTLVLDEVSKEELETSFTMENINEKDLEEAYDFIYKNNILDDLKQNFLVTRF